MSLPTRPPTLDYLRGIGLRQIAVTCLRIGCQRQAHMTFDALGLPGDTPFPQIIVRRRFTCSGCGSHAVDVSINWRDYNAYGAGRG
jgi:hypothetical protein